MGMALNTYHRYWTLRPATVIGHTRKRVWVLARVPAGVGSYGLSHAENLSQQMNNQTRTCPYCRSEINVLAKKCPNCQSDDRTVWAKHKLWFILLGSIVLVIIVSAISSSGGSPSNNAPSPAPVVAKAVIQNPIFDVPSLIGKNIDQIVQTLGKPDSEYTPTAQQKELGVNEGDNSYEKDGSKLLITYNVATRKVIDFFIDPTSAIKNSDGTITDTASLLILGNLKQGDPKYSVTFVKSIKNPSAYTGVKVIAK